MSDDWSNTDNTVDLCSPDTSSKSITNTTNMAQVNAQPQDFIVMDGQAVRIIRSSGKESPGRTQTSDALKIKSLQNALEEAYDTINKQRKELFRKTRKIEDLEKKLGLVPSGRPSCRKFSYSLFIKL